MPKSIVHIDPTADISPPAHDTTTEVAVIGTADEEPEDAEFGEVNEYSSADDVADDYGEDSDVHVTSEKIEEMGAQFWRVIVLEEQHVEDEEVEDGEAIENAPALGTVDVEATDAEVTYVTEEPPEDPEDGEVAINMLTGEIATGDGEPATLSYAHVDWDALNELAEEGVHVVGLADTEIDRQNIGDLDALAEWAHENRGGAVASYRDARDFEDDQEAMEMTHDVGSTVQSGDLMTWTHKSNDETTGVILGQLATNNRWHDPRYDPHDGDGYPVSIQSFKSDDIGRPSEPLTFEGGDADQEGPTNVLITQRYEGQDIVVLSNSLTTAGIESDYTFFDISQTQAFAASVVDTALTELSLDRDRVPFTGDGQSMIESKLIDELSDFEGGADDPFAEIDVDVPEPDDLDEEDQANRVWSGIKLTGELTQNAHEFDLELAVTI